MAMVSSTHKEELFPTLADVRVDVTPAGSGTAGIQARSIESFLLRSSHRPSSSEGGLIPLS
jgi:hypothetical protein